MARGGVQMRRVMLVLVAGSILLAQDFKPYAGSKLDEKATREASATAPGKQSEVYTTSDPFDKVYAFYKTLYKEFAMSRQPPKQPSGQQIKWAFFILDGGTNLSNSKYWMKIQRPYIGGVDGSDNRDITVIQTIRSK